MDVVILCGGKGTRLSEETVLKPKPMVEIGGMPFLWHIMKIYCYYGFKKFILALSKVAADHRLHSVDEYKRFAKNYWDIDSSLQKWLKLLALNIRED